MYNPFRWRGSVPLEDLFIYKSGLMKRETPLHKRLMEIPNKIENYADFNKYCSNKEVRFSMNFIKYRQLLFNSLDPMTTLPQTPFNYNNYEGRYDRDGGLMWTWQGRLTDSHVPNGSITNKRVWDIAKKYNLDPSRHFRRILSYALQDNNEGTNFQVAKGNGRFANANTTPGRTLFSTRG